MPLPIQDGLDEHIQIDRVSDLSPCAPFPKGKGDVALNLANFNHMTSPPCFGCKGLRHGIRVSSVDFI